MDGFAGLIVVGVFVGIVWIFLKRIFVSKGKNKSSAPKRATKIDDEIAKVLGGELVGGNEEWRSDPASESQMERIRQAGLNVRKKLTKGQASDIYGLSNSVEDDAAEKLRFFGVLKKGMSQTHARHAVRELFLDENNLTKWRERPATSLSKEQAKYFGIKVVKGVSQTQLDAALTQSVENNETLNESWDYIEDAISEVREPDVYESYDSGKPSISQVVAVAKKMIQSGTSAEAILDDEDAFFELLLSEYPKLRK